MRCKVERFERDTELNIKDWINQMETYFMIVQVPPEAFVEFILMKIVLKHLNKKKQFQTLYYLEFCEKLVTLFEEPDMANVYLYTL